MYGSLSEAISGLFGAGTEIEQSKPVHGGDINAAYRLVLSDGNTVFMKSNSKDNLVFFKAEMAGLNAIKATAAIKTPEVLGYGTDKDRAFLLMSFVEGAERARDFHKVFGHNLCMMHHFDTSGFVDGCFGFSEDNYIGAGYQKNTPKASWIDFFRECRLRPQFERAGAYFDSSEKSRIERLLERLDDYLTEPVAPSLLHGDLWGGNYIVGDDGQAWLIDPAVYVGHAEADMAMTELFGGFDTDFYRAYYEISPMEPGYRDRRDIYNLYHLLNHLNLFGGSYRGAVVAIINRYAG